MTDIWKDVVGYEDYFQVSNTGKIFSKRTNKELKLHINENGYVVFASKIGGRKGVAICLRIHILVAIAFIDNPENKPTVNHVDGIKINNFDTNLEWATSSEQSVHAYSTGLRSNAKGTKSLLSSLNDDDIKYIREHYIPKHGTYGMRGLGRKFGVSHSVIWRVIHETRYK
jgi:hypothetical protein